MKSANEGSSQIATPASTVLSTGEQPDGIHSSAAPRNAREELAVAFQVVLHPANQLLLERFLQDCDQQLQNQLRGTFTESKRGGGGRRVRLLDWRRGNNNSTPSHNDDEEEDEGSPSAKMGTTPGRQRQTALQRTNKNISFHGDMISTLLDKENTHSQLKSEIRKRVDKGSILTLVTPNAVIELIMLLDISVHEEALAILEEEERLGEEYRRILNEYCTTGSPRSRSVSLHSNSTVIDRSNVLQPASSSRATSASSIVLDRGDVSSVGELRLLKVTDPSERDEEGFRETYRELLIECAHKRLRLREDLQAQLAFQLGILLETDFSSPNRSPLHAHHTSHSTHHLKEGGKLSAKDIEWEMEEDERRRKRQAGIRAFNRRAQHPCVSLRDLVDKVFTFRTTVADAVGGVKRFFERLSGLEDELRFVSDEEEVDARKKIIQLERETAQELYSTVVRRAQRVVEIERLIQQERDLHQRINTYAQASDTARRTQIEVRILREDGTSKNESMKAELEWETQIQKALFAAETTIKAEAIPFLQQLQSSSLSALRTARDEVHGSFGGTKSDLDRHLHQHEQLSDRLEQKLALVGAALASVAARNGREAMRADYEHRRSIEVGRELIEQQNRLLDERRLAVLVSRYAGDHALRIQRNSAFLYSDGPLVFKDNSPTRILYRSATSPRRSWIHNAAASSTAKVVTESPASSCAACTTLAGVVSPDDIQLAWAVGGPQMPPYLAIGGGAPAWVLRDLLTSWFVASSGSAETSSSPTLARLLFIESSYPVHPTQRTARLELHTIVEKAAAASHQKQCENLSELVGGAAQSILGMESSFRKREGAPSSPTSSFIELEEFCFHLGITLRRPAATILCDDTALGPLCQPVSQQENASTHIAATPFPRCKPVQLFDRQPDFVGGPSTFINSCPFSTDPLLFSFERPDLDPLVPRYLQTYIVLMLSDYMFPRALYYQILRRHAAAIAAGQLDRLDKGAYSIDDTLAALPWKGTASDRAVRLRGGNPFTTLLTPHVVDVLISWAKRVVIAVLGEGMRPEGDQVDLWQPNSIDANTLSLEFYPFEGMVNSPGATPLVDGASFASCFGRALLDCLSNTKLVPPHVSPAYILYRTMRHLILPAFDLDFVPVALSRLELDYLPHRAPRPANPALPHPEPPLRLAKVVGPSVPYPLLLLLPRIFWGLHVVSETSSSSLNNTTELGELLGLATTEQRCRRAAAVSNEGCIALLSTRVLPLIEFWCDIAALSTSTATSNSRALRNCMNAAALHFCRSGSPPENTRVFNSSFLKTALVSVLNDSTLWTVRMLGEVTSDASTMAMSDAVRAQRGASTATSQGTLSPAIPLSAAAELLIEVFPELRLAAHEAQELLLASLGSLLAAPPGAPSSAMSPSPTDYAQVTDDVLKYHYLLEDVARTTLSFLTLGHDDNNDSASSRDEDGDRDLLQLLWSPMAQSGGGGENRMSHLESISHHVGIRFPLFVAVVLHLSESSFYAQDGDEGEREGGAPSLLGTTLTKGQSLRAMGMSAVAKRLLFES